ncbi:Fic family protein [Donghicola eburneus]|uniref:Fic family protein n=1 Tax=Donghicola eburneus TaxID=393278 RepID=UPI0008DF00C6|nr:Fic family protein [Donghicola eburneus]SFQ79712.1 Fic/DOC family protein [Donghicola eburneus]
MALETPARLEPCGLEETVPSALLELVHELRSAAKDLGTRLNTGVAAELRGMMRIANAQHSNRIEGRIAEPTDIERALAGRWADVEHPDMVQEIVAHVHVQAWVDAQAVEGTLPAPTSAAFIQELHRRLYDRMPPALRVAEHGHLSREILPGIFRDAGHDVTVGAHMPPSGQRIAAFMAHFERRYSGLTRGTTGRCLAIPAAHHRFCYMALPTC